MNIAGERYFTSLELRERWGGISHKTLWNWRRKWKGPPAVKIMGKLLFRERDVLEIERVYMNPKPE